MNIKKIFHCAHGDVEGIYFDAGSNTDVVIIINGHNGFYNYGMFPYIQKKLLENNISSFSFNFSHGGVVGDADFFSDLEKYEKNCMRLETEDTLCVLQNTRSGAFNIHSKIILLAHSLGGVPALFAAGKTGGKKIIDGIILVSTVQKLNFWPAELIREWKVKKVLYRKNNRTKQELPQGPELLEEVLQSETKWNVENAIKSLHEPILIVHGENDEAVPAGHANALFSWARENNTRVSLKIVPAATHTYNTKHPFENSTPQLEELISTAVAWIKELK